MQVYPVNEESALKSAGPSDLLELKAPPGRNDIFLPKELVMTFANGILTHEFIHLSGPTGSAKTSLIEALSMPENWMPICAYLEHEPKPLVVYPNEMVIYESPGELRQRRSIKDGYTFDEKSELVRNLELASSDRDGSYTLIWLREIGRVHSAAVQGGLLDIMTHGIIHLCDGQKISGINIAWVADSNYQAEADSVHTLVVFDDALRRRFGRNITLSYLDVNQEATALEHIVRREPYLRKVSDADITSVVKLGQTIRKHKGTGSLRSVTPPTIYGYLSFLRQLRTLPDCSLEWAARCTLLGNASRDDSGLVTETINEAFGLSKGTGVAAEAM